MTDDDVVHVHYVRVFQDLQEVSLVQDFCRRTVLSNLQQRLAQSRQSTRFFRDDSAIENTSQTGMATHPYTVAGETRSRPKNKRKLHRRLEASFRKPK
eukprot:1187761-Prorocentrum_minimum.AAC.2